MSFNINNKLVFIDTFQFLNSSLDSLVKNLDKDDLKYLSQEFHSNLLDLVKQERFCPYEYMSGLKSFKNNFLAKKIYSSLTDKKLVIKIKSIFLKSGTDLK